MFNLLRMHVKQIVVVDFAAIVPFQIAFSLKPKHICIIHYSRFYQSQTTIM